MKFWPFSKKAEEPVLIEDNGELPPGVMLAEPDAADMALPQGFELPGDAPLPAPTTLASPPSEEAFAMGGPMMAGAEQPLPQPTQSPDLNTFFEQNNLSMISQGTPPTPADFSAEPDAYPAQEYNPASFAPPPMTAETAFSPAPDMLGAAGYDPRPVPLPTVMGDPFMEMSQAQPQVYGPSQPLPAPQPTIAWAQPAPVERPTSEAASTPNTFEFGPPGPDTSASDNESAYGFEFGPAPTPEATLPGSEPLLAASTFELAPAAPEPSPTAETPPFSAQPETALTPPASSAADEAPVAPPPPATKSDWDSDAQVFELNYGPSPAPHVMEEPLPNTAPDPRHPSPMAGQNTPNSMQPPPAAASAELLSQAAETVDHSFYAEPTPSPDATFNPASSETQMEISPSVEMSYTPTDLGMDTLSLDPMSVTSPPTPESTFYGLGDYASSPSVDGSSDFYLAAPEPSNTYYDLSMDAAGPAADPAPATPEASADPMTWTGPADVPVDNVYTPEASSLEAPPEADTFDFPSNDGFEVTEAASYVDYNPSDTEDCQDYEEESYSAETMEAGTTYVGDGLDDLGGHGADMDSYALGHYADPEESGSYFVLDESATASVEQVSPTYEAPAYETSPETVLAENDSQVEFVTEAEPELEMVYEAPAYQAYPAPSPEQTTPTYVEPSASAYNTDHLASYQPAPSPEPAASQPKAGAKPTMTKAAAPTPVEPADFAQRVLWQESRQVKDSIDDLVARYFSQQSENSV